MRGTIRTTIHVTTLHHDGNGLHTPLTSCLYEPPYLQHTHNHPPIPHLTCPPYALLLPTLHPHLLPLATISCKYHLAPARSGTHSFLCMTLPFGTYIVTAIMEYDGPNKLGHIRLTHYPELCTPPEVIAYLWAGDRVALLEQDTTPIRLPTGELRTLVHLVHNNWPKPQCGWVTYSRHPNTTWLSLQQQPSPYTSSSASLRLLPPATLPPELISSSPSDAAVTTPHHTPITQTVEKQMWSGTHSPNLHTPNTNKPFNRHPFQ